MNLNEPEKPGEKELRVAKLVEQLFPKPFTGARWVAVQAYWAYEIPALIILKEIRP